MNFKGYENTFLELTILGYQYPELSNEPYDSDWLNVKLRVRHLKGDWEIIDPCLLTWEVQRLADWFISVAEGNHNDFEECFIEPHLRFKFVDESFKTLRVYFELECRPYWAPHNGAGMEDCWIDLSVNQEDLKFAAQDLYSELKRFPIRDSENL